MKSVWTQIGILCLISPQVNEDQAFRLLKPKAANKSFLNSINGESLPGIIYRSLDYGEQLYQNPSSCLAPSLQGDSLRIFCILCRLLLGIKYFHDLLRRESISPGTEH